MNRTEFNTKVMDYSFDAIKFFITLFSAAFTIYLATATIFVTLAVSDQTSSETVTIARLVALLFSVAILLFMWGIVYLVRRAGHELLSRIQQECPEDEHPRFKRAYVKLELVGLAGALAGTAIVVAIFFFLISSKFW